MVKQYLGSEIGNGEIVSLPRNMRTKPFSGSKKSQSTEQKLDGLQELE